MRLQDRSKAFRIRGTLTILIPGLLLAVSSGGCTSSSEHDVAESENEDHASCHEHEEEPASTVEELSAESVYHLNGNWTDQNGNTLSLSRLRGKPVIAAMAYTRCKYVCPRIVAEMKALQAKMPAKLRKTARFVLVSLDSEHDGPKTLNEYAKKHALDPETWSLLNGSEDHVRALAAVLGVKYKREPNGIDYSHSYIISVLDKEGVVRHQMVGAGQATDPVLSLLGGL